MDRREQLLAYRQDVLTLLQALAAVSHEMTADTSEGVDPDALPAVYDLWNRTADATDALLASLGTSHPVTSAFVCQNAADLNRIAAMAAVLEKRHPREECLARAVGKRSELRSLQAWLDRITVTDLGPMFAELSRDSGDTRGTKSRPQKSRINPEDVKTLRRIKRAIPDCENFKAACLQVVSDETEYDRLRKLKTRKPEHWRKIMGDI